MRYKMQRKKRKGYGMRVPVVLLSARSIVYNSTPGRSSDSLHLLRLPGRSCGSTTSDFIEQTLFEAHSYGDSSCLAQDSLLISFFRNEFENRMCDKSTKKRISEQIFSQKVFYFGKLFCIPYFKNQSEQQI